MVPVQGWLRGWFATALVLVGAVLLQAGLVAGYVNREVLDLDRLAADVDELRRQPAVSAALGRKLTDAFLVAQPDAVAIRPLIDSGASPSSARPRCPDPRGRPSSRCSDR